jgi:hypothetical protein
LLNKYKGCLLGLAVRVIENPLSINPPGYLNRQIHSLRYNKDIDVVLLYLIIPFGYGMIMQLVFGHPWGNRPMSDTALAIVGPEKRTMSVAIVVYN